MRTWKRGLVLAALLTVSAVAVLSLLSGPSFSAKPAPSCENQCLQDYKDCQRLCSKPNVACFVACETVLEWCLAGCGGIVE